MLQSNNGLGFSPRSLPLENSDEDRNIREVWRTVRLVTFCVNKRKKGRHNIPIQKTNVQYLKVANSGIILQMQPLG